MQNHYNLVASRRRRADRRSRRATASPTCPFFPLGGFSPLQSATLSEVAARLGATPMQVALAWLLRRSPNILLIPGTSSVAHLRENLAVAELELPDDAMADLDRIAAAGAGWLSGRATATPARPSQRHLRHRPGLDGERHQVLGHQIELASTSLPPIHRSPASQPTSGCQGSWVRLSAAGLPDMSGGQGVMSSQVAKPAKGAMAGRGCARSP